MRNICPVTREPASLSMTPEGDMVEVDCPTCGRFDISRRSYDSMFQEDKGDIRRHALQQAKEEARPDEIPVIASFET